MRPRELSLLIVLSAIWGGSFILIRLALMSFPPLWVSLGRVSFGVMLLWAVVFWTRSALPPRKKIVPLLFVGLLNNALPWTFFALGEQTVSASLAAILNATTPIWGVLINLLLRDSYLSARSFVGVGLGFFGVAIVVSDGLRASFASVEGVLLIVAASVCYAIATVFAKRKLSGIAPLGLAAGQLSSAWLFILPVALLSPWPTQVTLEATFALLVLGVFGSGVAYWMYFALLGRMHSNQVMAVTYLIPIWGQLWSFVGGEPLRLSSLIGVVVILFGVWLVNSPPKLSLPFFRRAAREDRLS